jgi:putative transposase
LILDGTVVRVRLHRKTTSIALLVLLGVREDGQKVLPVKYMGGETAEAWRSVLDDLVMRGLRKRRALDPHALAQGRAMVRGECAPVLIF